MHFCTPLLEDDVRKLRVGDKIYISGVVLCGRDAVLPKIVSLLKEGREKELGIDLKGQVIFHTAVSPAGVGPTSSNKLEIEDSIIPLSKAGIKIHLGKGALKKQTILGLEKFNSIYAVMPPVTALLGSKIIDSKLLAFPELGMEAFYLLKVDGFPAIVASAHGESIYDE